MQRLSFLQELGFEHHRAAAGAAFDFGGAVGEADVFDHRAALERERGAFHLEVFDEGDQVAFGKQRAVAVFHVHENIICLSLVLTYFDDLTTLKIDI